MTEGRKGPRRYFIVNLRLDELSLIEDVLSVPEAWMERDADKRNKLYHKIKAIRERLEIRQAYEIRKGQR